MAAPAMGSLLVHARDPLQITGASVNSKPADSKPATVRAIRTAPASGSSSDGQSARLKSERNWIVTSGPHLSENGATKREGFLGKGVEMPFDSVSRPVSSSRTTEAPNERGT